MPVRKPAWLKKDLRSSPALRETVAALGRTALATVCEEAACPNRLECHSLGRVAFLILGRACTRACAFCGVTHAAPAPPDPAEPDNVARAVAELGLRHAVITSVTRDDLPDGGAHQFVLTVAAVRRLPVRSAVEILIPDLRGDRDALREVARAGADIVNHNLETVPRLYPAFRPQADYARSLRVLESVKAQAPSLVTKSGLLVGLGETTIELRRTLSDLRRAGCDMVTIGQYLPPTRFHPQAAEYVTPDAFSSYESEALALGFRSVASGPFVRSSYGAEETYRDLAPA